LRRIPKKRSDTEALYAAALGALTRRAYSVHDMRKWLEQRAESRGLADDVLLRLKERGYVDDARYAKQFARQRAEGRRQGRFRIARDLRARGVPDRHIEAALDEVFAETDQTALLRMRIERKLRSLRGRRTVPAPVGAGPRARPHKMAGTVLDQKQFASLYASLLRAGFPSDLIRRELRALSKLADTLPEGEPLEASDNNR
jgi:SOS response regulatory protein OraA/RecX